MPELRKSFWGHTIELLNRVRLTLITIAVFFLAFLIVPYKGVPVSALALDKLRNDLLPTGLKLYSFNFFDGVYALFMSALFMALLASLPVIAYQLYKFVGPALKPRERRLVFWVCSAFTVLFLLGVLVGYFVIVPISLKVLVMFISFAGAEPLISISSFFSFVTLSLAVMGFCFTFPVYLVALAKLGFLSADSLTSKRKFVIVGTVVVLSVITPDPTPVSTVILSVILLALYELTIVVIRLTKGKNN